MLEKSPAVLRTVPRTTAHLSAHRGANSAQTGSRVLSLSGRMEGLNRKWRRENRCPRVSTDSAFREALLLWIELERLQMSIVAAFSRQMILQTTRESDRIGWDASELAQVNSIGRQLKLEEADVYFVSMLTQLMESPELSSDPVKSRLECARQLLPRYIRRKIPKKGSRPKVGFDNRWVHPRNVLSGPMTHSRDNPLTKPHVKSFSTRSMGIGRALPQLLQYVGLRMIHLHREQASHGVLTTKTQFVPPLSISHCPKELTT